MTAYAAPVRDMRFVLEHLCAIGETALLPGLEEATPDLVAAVLEEAGRLASEVLAPINHAGDRQGARLEDGIVRTPDGWKHAYDTFVEGGWVGAVFDPAYGGMGLPWVVNAAIQEMIQAANMSFALCPMLTQSAIEAILMNASDALRRRYVANMVSGRWTGTMNLTESQAGSDLGAIRARAERDGDHYRIYGQKIFITYADHDLAENVIHLVLARIADAPAGVKGISLFVVPKILVGDDGALGARNDVHVVSLEHKLGIHASPTAIVSFGDGRGAVGYLVGEENRGLAYMFVMMNLARLVVGLQGLGISDRAYQQARDYARERVQGQPIGGDGADRRTIIEHADVRRMLMTMKASVEAMRAVAYLAARSIDFAHRHPDAAVRAHHQARLDLLTPVVKGWCTELSVELTSLGVQIHGGMGYVEETGACQHFRDARITPIYEGTTGIQAQDLVGRKILRDGGAAVRDLIAEMRAIDGELASNRDPDCLNVRRAVNEGIDAFAAAVDWLLDVADRDPRLPAAASVPVLELAGTVVGGWLMAKALLVAKARIAAGDDDAGFLEAKIATARFYADHILPQAKALGEIVVRGSESVMALDAEQF